MFSCFIDHSISETQAKSNFKNQSQKENTCKDNDVRLNRVTRVTKTDMTENTKENNHDKLLLGIEKSIRQFKVDADNKVVKENADNYVAPGDDEKSSSSYYENGKICQEALTKSSGTSTDTEATKPVLSMDVTHNASPPQVIYGSIDFEESINTAQCNRGINEGIAKDSTDLPKTDEFSVDLESALADGKSERQGDGDVYEPGEKSQKLAISGDRRRKKKDNPTEMSTTATKNTSCKEKAAGKKVTFNLGEDKSPDTEQQNSTEEINKEEPRMMFSDEEDGENKCRSIDEDVNQRISRIQNLLRSDRLRTNRKRKFPVV